MKTYSSENCADAMVMDGLTAEAENWIDNETIRQQHEEIERLKAFVGWVDSWVSNPVGAYSVCALDGLFGMTRDKIAALSGHQ